MRKRLLRFPTTALALGLALSGCGGNLGALGDILAAGGLPGAGGQQQGQIRAEVQGVDTRQQLLHVTGEDGRSGSILFDQNTVVVYRQQQHPVTALERGDLIVIHAQQAGQNRLYASRIDVQQSVQERTGQQGSVGTGQRQQFAGRVGQIDHQRGVFELQTQYSGTILVSLPYNPPSVTVDQFRRLQSGQSVRIEATPVSNSRVELYRFY